MITKHMITLIAWNNVNNNDLSNGINIDYQKALPSEYYIIIGMNTQSNLKMQLTNEVNEIKCTLKNSSIVVRALNLPLDEIPHMPRHDMAVEL